MAIRKNTNPRMMDLQPEMQDILRRNGMQAHVVSDGTGYRLVVQGHDSPLLTYDLTERQMLALTDWGTNSANKKAYNVFTSIVGKDFYMPKNFVVTRNFAASLFRNIKYFTLRKLYLCRKWMQKRLQKTITTGITLPNFDFLA